MYSYLDTPLDPYGDYTEQEKELERQRQLAMALYKNEIATANQNGQSNLPAGGLAAFIGQLGGNLGAQSTERDLYAKQQEIDRNRMAANSKFYASIPQGTPGKPEVDIPAYATGLPPWAVGAKDATGPVPELPPILPKAATESDWANWAGGAPQTPGAQKIADMAMQRFLPMSPDTAYQKEADRDIKRQNLQRMAEAALLRSQDRNLSLDERAQWHDRYASYLEDMGAAGIDVRQGMLKVAQTNAETNQQRLQSQQGLGGEVDYYNLSPEDQATVRNLANGSASLTTYSSRNGQRALWQSRVMNYAPLANLTAAPAVQKDFTSGPTSRNITSLNTSLMHMGTMSDLADALQNNDVPLANSLLNVISKNTGNPEVTNFNTAKQAVGEELMRSFRGVGAGTEQEIQNWKANFDAANSPEQLKGALRIAGELLGGRIKSVNDQWRRGTGTPTDFPGILSPANVETLTKLGVKNTGLMDTGQNAPVPTFGVPPQPAVRPDAYGTGLGAGLGTDSPAMYQAYQNSVGGQQEAPGTPLRTGAAAALPSNTGMLPQGIGGGAPVQVSSKAEYDALPSGAKYIAPDGTIRTKP